MNIWAGKAHTPPRPQRAAQSLPIDALQNFLTTSQNTNEHWTLFQTKRIKKSGGNLYSLAIYSSLRGTKHTQTTQNK